METREGTLSKLQTVRSASLKQTPREGLDESHNSTPSAAEVGDHQQLAAAAVTDPRVTFVDRANKSRPETTSDSEICVCELAASVVWNRRDDAGEKSLAGGLQLHGVRFMSSNARDKTRIHALFYRIVTEWVDRIEFRRILDGANLVDVARPAATEFDLLLRAIAGELDELGRMMLTITGQGALIDENGTAELKRTKGLRSPGNPVPVVNVWHPRL